MPQASVLKTGHGEPTCPVSSSKNLPQKLDKLIIFEELEPVIEEQVRSWGIRLPGKKYLQGREGEYSANMLREKVLLQPLNLKTPANVPARPPILCQDVRTEAFITH